MVEPIFGVLGDCRGLDMKNVVLISSGFMFIGAVAVSFATKILPIGLAFAAGAMIFIVCDDIIPEAHSSGNGMLATWGCIAGFIVIFFNSLLMFNILYIPSNRS